MHRMWLVRRGSCGEEGSEPGKFGRKGGMSEMGEKGDNVEVVQSSKTGIVNCKSLEMTPKTISHTKWVETKATTQQQLV